MRRCPDACGEGSRLSRASVTARRQPLSRLQPRSTSRRLFDHWLAATGEGEALRTEGPHHNSLDKRISNEAVSRPLDDKVRPGSSARILSGNEGLHCPKRADRDGLWQVIMYEVARRVEVVNALDVQRSLVGGVVNTQRGGKV